MNYTKEDYLFALSQLRTENIIDKQCYLSMRGNLGTERGCEIILNFLRNGCFMNLMNKTSPYLEIRKVVVTYKYNPNYGDDRICECGHTYYRHFDSHEDMYPCGCKYCGCTKFKENNNYDIQED